MLYQIKTKRDSGVLKAYITFTYRMMHPGVSARLMLYGLIIALPGVFFFKDLYWRIFFTGAEFTYNFTVNDADFLKNGERFSGMQ